MISLTKEDGSGLATANSYASVDDGDAYHLAHLYATKWTVASQSDKATALVMATRLIDAYCRFLGSRKSDTQALQWPRVEVPDVESSSNAYMPGLLRLGILAPVYLSSETVPVCVIHATCEEARTLLIEDRTANPTGEGLASSVVDDSKFVFDKTDRPPVITATAQALLRRVVVGGAGQARLVRA
jgi:hypothetical protein